MSEYPLASEIATALVTAARLCREDVEQIIADNTGWRGPWYALDAVLTAFPNGGGRDRTGIWCFCRCPNNFKLKQKQGWWSKDIAAAVKAALAEEIARNDAWQSKALALFLKSSSAALARSGEGALELHMRPDAPIDSQALITHEIIGGDASDRPWVAKEAELNRAWLDKLANEQRLLAAEDALWARRKKLIEGEETALAAPPEQE